MRNEEFRLLLSKQGEEILEEMALRAREESLKHFGKAVALYTPIYISNHCVNRCLYCSFNTCNKIKRSKLTYEEIRVEAEEVAKSGIKHVLLLTGESEVHTDVEYLLEAVKILREYFPSVSLEVYPMDTDDYKKFVQAGADGVTVYQEAYDRKIYEQVHVHGPKKDYDYRYNTPDRAAMAGVRTLNMGALIGLGNWREEIYNLGVHIKEICEKYPEVEVGISLPRIKGIESTEEIAYELNEVGDREFVQALCALRLFLPHCSINISTRESVMMRRNLLNIGVNKMSAGVSTEVGGYKVNKDGGSQFEISDESSVEDVMKMIREQGYQPVLKDWVGYE